MELSEYTRNYASIRPILNLHYNTLKWILLLSPLIMRKTRLSEAGPLCVEAKPESGEYRGTRYETAESETPRAVHPGPSPSHSAAQFWVSRWGYHGWTCSQWSGLSPGPGGPHAPAVTRGCRGGYSMVAPSPRQARTSHSSQLSSKEPGNSHSSSEVFFSLLLQEQIQWHLI